MLLSKIKLLPLIFLNIVILTSCIAEKSVINSNNKRIAIKAYDPVAYFEANKAVEGLSTISYQWNNAIWNFSSSRNKKLFIADPEKYAPAYGGYCAWAIGQGYTADIDPNAWKIHEGRLYLNYNKDIQKKWENKLEENIRKAETTWPDIQAKIRDNQKK